MTGETGTGTYGYYYVSDLATRGDVHANIQNLYVQDTWHVTRDLTLTFGLRWDANPGPFDAVGRRPF